jgi:hypothetical protein
VPGEGASRGLCLRKVPSDAHLHGKTVIHGPSRTQDRSRIALGTRILRLDLLYMTKSWSRVP